MINKTTNYNLSKPTEDEFYDVNVTNGNMDIIDSELKKVNEHLGDMTQVPTTNKTTSGAITELFTDVSNGKALVGTAITDVDNRVVVPTNPTFGDLVSAIGSINTGKKWASGTAPLSNVTNSFYNNGYVSEYYTHIIGLEFKPSIVLIWEQRDGGDTYIVTVVYEPMKYFIGSNGSQYLLGDNAFLKLGEFKLPVTRWNNSATPSFYYMAIE